MTLDSIAAGRHERAQTDIGIGLPNAVRGVERGGIVDWARRAEEAGFSSLGTIDGGRLTLGLAPGVRRDDFECVAG